jgi:beta-galactosidase
MNLKQIIIALYIASTLIGCSDCEVSNPRQYVDLNQEWKFYRDTIANNLYEADIDDSRWETVALPHTPRIEPLVVNDQWQGIAWYRKHFSIEKSNIGKNAFIKFDAAMQVADVWLNGKHLITHFGGYLPFGFDITENMLAGENILTVKLNNEDNPQVPPGKPLDSLDFNLYGGLYRNVSLIFTDKVHISDLSILNNTGGGVFVTFDSISSKSAVLNIKTDVINQCPNEILIDIRNTLVNSRGEKVAVATSEEKLLKASDDITFQQSVKIGDPILWQPNSPYLYTLRTTIIKNHKVIDEVETSIGIRKAELKPDGFYLNGEKFFINGTNRHQEYPYIGYALSDEAQYRDAIKIKSAGFDLVRCSHYPQSEAFLDACDELGLLVMNSIPGWQFMGDDTFKANSLDDCRNMIRRDRNHPSVVFWEVSLNETGMDDSFMDEANRILDEEFSSEAMSAGWIDYQAYDVFIPARQHAQPPNYWNNYRVGEKAVFIAEYGDWEYYAQDAGFNQAAFKNLKPEERTSRQPRRTGEKGMLQQALNFQESSNSNRKGKSTIGQANWLMFDYNRGYADDIESSGIADIFRIPKYSWYFFQSQRSPVKLDIEGVLSGPMVYVASYWQPESSLDVRVFSNCEEVGLFLNDRLVERRGHDRDEFSTNLAFPPITFHVKEYTEGTLKAIGYIAGVEVASHSVRTPEEPVKIELTSDLSNKPVSKSGKDIVFIYARVLDSHGKLCPVNDILVEFTIEGNALLIGQNPMITEAGIATVLLQTNGDFKPIVVSAKAIGLDQGRLILE